MNLEKKKEVFKEVGEPNVVSKTSYHDDKLQNAENSVHPHHRVTLSCLWHIAKEFFYFAKCDYKHNDDQRVV